MPDKPPTSPSLLAGIDPGTHTGFALYDAARGELETVTALPFWEAANRLRASAPRLAAVVIEDARLVGLYARHRKLSGARRDRAARSVGMIDRDVRLWLDLCDRLGLPVMTVQPTRSKWDARTFARVTGWPARTNEHGRDAARLVFGLGLMDQQPIGGIMMPTIEIKPNNCITNDPCAICGARCDPTGFDPFLSGTWELVCDRCATERTLDTFYRPLSRPTERGGTPAP